MPGMNNCPSDALSLDGAHNYEKPTCAVHFSQLWPLRARVSQRLLALAATFWHNNLIGQPGRSLIAYDH